MNSKIHFTTIINDSNRLDRLLDPCLQPVGFLCRAIFGKDSFKVYRINNKGTMLEEAPSSAQRSVIHRLCMFVLGAIVLIPATLIGGILKGISVCTPSHQIDKKKLHQYLHPLQPATNTTEQAAAPLAPPIDDVPIPISPPVIPTSSSTSGPSIISEQPQPIPSSFVFTKKLYETPTEAVLTIPTKLGKDALNTLLNFYPEIDFHMVAQGKMSARASILAIYESGLAFRLGKGTTANNSVIDQMRYIISKVQEAPPKKKSGLLQRLATCLEDCVPVTQGRLNGFCMELSGQGGFPAVFSAFLYNLKEQIVDQTIFELYPEMQELTYASATHYSPQLQHPHTKNAYLKACGKNIGFEPPGSSSDPNATRELSVDDLQKFQALFKKKLEETILREFVIAINKQEDRLPNEPFFQWSGDQVWKNEALFHEDHSYPAYATPTDQAKELMSACITEATARKALQSLGFMEQEAVSTADG